MIVIMATLRQLFLVPTVGVASLMKKQYSFIDHQYDVWHKSKSVHKKAD